MNKLPYINLHMLSSASFLGDSSLLYCDLIRESINPLRFPCIVSIEISANLRENLLYD